MDKKPVDHCIEFIENKIKELGYESHEQFDAFSAGLEIGLEAGIKQANGDFDINNTEESEVDGKENED